MARVVLPIAVVLSLICSFGVELAQAVQACSDPNLCAQVSVGSNIGRPGDTVTVDLGFRQGPDDGLPGGIDEIAALALTLNLGGDGTAAAALTLADCAANATGLPNAIKPTAAISNFNVSVQNAHCTNGRTHCLCPDPGSGITPDGFINLAIYGPNLQTLSGPVIIPTLPNGQLLTIDLQISPGASGNIPLHLLSVSTDNPHPKSTALLSIGDRLQKDQTCIPIPETPPCGAPDAVSQVAAIDGSIVVIGTDTPTPPPTATSTETPTITPTASSTQVPTATPTHTEAPTATLPPTPTPTDTSTATPVSTPTPTATPLSSPTAVPPVPCVGDCDGNRVVTVSEVLTMVNIALGNTPASECVPGDENVDHQITVDEILTALSNALSGCDTAH